MTTIVARFGNLYVNYNVTNDQVIIGLNNVYPEGNLLAGNIADNECINYSPTVGVDVLPFSTYRYFSISNQPSSVVTDRFVVTWINAQDPTATSTRLQYFCSSIAGYLAGSVGLVLPVNGAIVQDSDVAYLTVLNAVKQVFNQQS